MKDIIPVGGTALQANTVLTDDIFSKWLHYTDVMPKSHATYTRAIKMFVAYLRWNRIDAPTRDDIITYRDLLKKEHKPSTVQLYITAVRLFFRWTAQENIYPNIADHIKGAKVDREHKKDYLTAAQVRNVLQAVDKSTLHGKRDYALLTLMFTTGLRTISISRANVEDIGTYGSTAALFYQGKGHEDRADTVMLAEPVETAIREYLKARGQAAGKEPLFISLAHRNTGERMTTRSISRIIKEALIAAGYDSDRLTAHSLRHTAATLNLLNGATIEETQQLLGHSNINTTMIYSHALERINNHSEQRIAKAIFETG